MLGMGIWACQQKQPKTESASKALTEGEKLAKVYCATCHAYPDPSVLDLQTWKNHVLPRMGYMMGIFPDDSIRETLFEDGSAGDRVRQAAVFPKKAVIRKELWDRIQQFYLDNAPEKLEIPVRKTPIKEGLENFEVRNARIQLNPPSTTLVRMGEGELYIGDAHTQSILQLNRNEEVTSAAKVKEGAVWLQETEDKLWVTVMGSFSPTDAASGMILTLPKNGGSGVEIPVKDLQRPVHSVLEDMDGDGLTDIIVCEFGKWTGGLSLFHNEGNGTYKKSMISAWPGATKAYVRDMNGDGLKDIVALFGQGNEGIDIFYARGDGQYTRNRVLAFSPSNGSSFFDLLDWDGDGDLDILYTAGDNADYSPVLKPYHGIYLFTNDGENHFEQNFFYQLNGAYGAIARDFDQDGDLDIAAISFFPDFKNNPEEGFVYLENKGEMNFEASTFEGVSRGRWIVMDAADFDGDGDDDIVLGSLAFEVVPPMGLVQKWAEAGIPYVILENKTK